MNTFAKELRGIPARFVSKNNYTKGRSDAQSEKSNRERKERE